jgi:hypothetical protein
MKLTGTWTTIASLKAQVVSYFHLDDSDYDQDVFNPVYSSPEMFMAT